MALQLKKAVKADKPFYFYFLMKGADGKPVLFVERKEAEANQKGKKAKITARDKKNLSGEVRKLEGNKLQFVGMLGNAPTSQVEKTFKRELAKEGDLKTVATLLRTAEIITLKDLEDRQKKARSSEAEAPPTVESTPKPKKKKKRSRASQDALAEVMAQELIAQASQVAEAFRVATEEIDSEITKMQKFLLTQEDEELQRIGEYGMNGITGNFKVPLMAALFELQGSDAEGRKKAAKKATATIAKFREHLDASDNAERIDALENNPWSIPVLIKARLTEAFDDMDQILPGLQ